LWASAWKTTEIGGVRSQAHAVFLGALAMHYRLREGLHYCIAGSNVIFLDVHRSRYFALSPVLCRTFQRLAEGRGLALEADEASLQGLISKGLLTKADKASGNLEPVRVPSATADLLNVAGPSIRIRFVAIAVCWEARIAAQLRIRSLASVLSRARTQWLEDGHTRPEDQGQIEAFSRASGHAAFLLGRTDRCLVRSLALFSILRNRGIAAQFVIGVRSQPFAAHAWVQYGDTVLNDGAEQVSYYTPILALP